MTIIFFSKVNFQFSFPPCEALKIPLKLAIPIIQNQLLSLLTTLDLLSMFSNSNNVQKPQDVKNPFLNDDDEAATAVLPVAANLTLVPTKTNQISGELIVTSSHKKQKSKSAAPPPRPPPPSASTGSEVGAGAQDVGFGDVNLAPSTFMQGQESSFVTFLPSDPFVGGGLVFLTCVCYSLNFFLLSQSLSLSLLEIGFLYVACCVLHLDIIDSGRLTEILREKALSLFIHSKQFHA